MFRNITKWKKLLASGKELVIDYENKCAYVWTINKNIEIPYELAIQLSQSCYFILDGGNDYYNTESYVIDYEKIREDGMKNLQPEKQLNLIFEQYDPSHQPLLLKDF